jgi:hypothetical protein
MLRPAVVSGRGAEAMTTRIEQEIAEAKEAGSSYAVPLLRAAQRDHRDNPALISVLGNGISEIERLEAAAKLGSAGDSEPPKRWACEVLEVARDGIGGVTLAVGWKPEPSGGWVDADEAEACAAKLRAGRRAAAEALIAEIGAPGPESVEETAGRAVAEIQRLRECMRRAGLAAFQRDRTPAEVADHLGDVIASYAGAADKAEAENAKLRAVAVDAARIGYAGGHNDTVEGTFGDPQECAEEIVAELVAEAPQAKLREVSAIFDGPPGPEAGRFVEVEDREGRSLRLGTWRELDGGLWALDFVAIVEEPAK